MDLQQIDSVKNSDKDKKQNLLEALSKEPSGNRQLMEAEYQESKRVSMSSELREQNMIRSSDPNKKYLQKMLSQNNLKVSPPNDLWANEQVRKPRIQQKIVNNTLFMDYQQFIKTLQPGDHYCIWSLTSEHHYACEICLLPDSKCTKNCHKTCFIKFSEKRGNHKVFPPEGKNKIREGKQQQKSKIPQNKFGCGCNKKRCSSLLCKCLKFGKQCTECCNCDKRICKNCDRRIFFQVKQLNEVIFSSSSDRSSQDRGYIQIIPEIVNYN